MAEKKLTRAEREAERRLMLANAARTRALAEEGQAELDRRAAAEAERRKGTGFAPQN